MPLIKCTISRMPVSPLLVRYDLDGIRKVFSRQSLAGRPTDLWRYRELLPVRRTRDIVSLGEPMTPAHFIAPNRR